MTNAYIAVQVDSEGHWQWRIECIEGYYPWHGHYATEKAARAAGKNTLLEEAFERRSRLIAESMDLQERRHGRAK